jgi:23S rRNA (pseudouridine1915-N3)-methyltransferase
LKLIVIAVGNRMPGWIDAGFEEYARRMPREAPIDLIQVKPEPRGSATPVERLTLAEAKRVRAVLPDGCYTVALDERGQTCTTKRLAERLEQWQMERRHVALVVGGPDGLDPSIKREADWLWSLSPLTLPHGLVRVLLAEQLYRAASILKSHPYHRE